MLAVQYPEMQYLDSDRIFITGCIRNEISCQNDEIFCSQRWIFNQNDDIFVSVHHKTTVAPFTNMV